MDTSIDGKVAIVTGAARGIGAATARALVEHGARVCIADLDFDLAQELAASIGAPAFACRVDVTSTTSVGEMVAAVHQRVGPVELLVANAGVAPTGAIVDTPLSIEQLTMEVNHFGVVRCVQAVLPDMLTRGAGHIVVVASLAGRLPIAGMAAYVASKHAVVGWAASLREELAGRGVVVNTILPTAVRTRLSDGLPTEGLGTIEPELVAQSIVSASTRAVGERVVPRWLTLPSRFEALLPGGLREAVRSLLRANRLMTADRSARAEYETSVRRQADQA